MYYYYTKYLFHGVLICLYILVIGSIGANWIAFIFIIDNLLYFVFNLILGIFIKTCIEITAYIQNILIINIICHRHISQFHNFS